MGVKTVISNRLSVIGKVAPEPEPELCHSGHHASGMMIRNPDVPVIKLFNRDEGDTGDKNQETGIKEMERIIGID